MNVEQRLRSALREGAARVHVPEPGPGAARLRAAQRARRLSALAAAVVAVVLAGGFATVWRALDPAPTVVMDGSGGGAASADGSHPAPEPLTLQWRDAEGLLGEARELFLGSDGAYYALSTAPGTRYRDYPRGDAPQALYRSEDGLDWEAVPLGDDPWVADLGERDGLLYALSTAPGTAGGSGRIALSGDRGQTWQRADLPSSAAPPQASVRLLDGHVTGHLAVGDDLLLAAVRTRYPIDVESLAEAGGAGEAPFWSSTPRGLVLHEAPADSDGVPDPDRPVPGEPVADPPPGEPSRTITWDDMGLAGPDDLAVDELFVSRDGIDWEAVPSPFGGRVLDGLTATPHGFVAVLHAPAARGQASVELLRSTDGVTWEPLEGDGTLAAAGPLRAFGVVDGQRMLAVPHGDGGALVVLTSDDGGRTWSATDLVAVALDDGVAHAAVVGLATGPLGAALAAVTVADETSGAEHSLFTSPDGLAWSATPLVDIAGDSPGARIAWVTVGADAVVLGATWPPAEEGAPATSRTFVGTPRR